MSGAPAPDARLGAAAAALLELGLTDVVVEVAGHEADIAVLRGPAARLAELVGPAGAELAAKVAGTGFRYVAVDLAEE